MDRERPTRTMPVLMYLVTSNPYSLCSAKRARHDDERAQQACRSASMFRAASSGWGHLGSSQNGIRCRDSPMLRLLRHIRV